MKKIKRNFVLDFNKLFLLGSIGYIFISLFKINILKINTNDIMYLFLDVFGSLDIKSNNFIISYSMYIYNFIFILQVCSNYIYKDFNKNSIYIFTRTDNKNNWINNKSIELFLIIIIYFSIQFILVFFLGIINGFEVINVLNLVICLIAIILNIALNLMVLSLISNIIAFKFNDILGYTIGISIFSLSLLMVYILNLFNVTESIYKFIPFVNSITSWSNTLNTIINRGIYLFDFYLLENNIFISVVINFFVIIILQSIIKRIINNIDIL